MTTTVSKYNFYPFNYEGLVLADDECAVIKGKNPMPGFSGHCGYCIFPKDEIPEEWHGDYNADSLGYGIAHGGLTYADIQGGDEEARTAALKELWAEKEARYAAAKAVGEEFVNLWSEYHERGEKLKRTFPYTHVVFGFDTAHYRDDWNYSLHDPEYVMRLAKEMRAEIAARAKRHKAAA